MESILSNMSMRHGERVTRQTDQVVSAQSSD